MERIGLEIPRAASYPVVKRTALGQTFNGAVLKVDTRDQMIRAADGSQVPKVKADGKHAKELVVHTLVLPGTTAPVGLGDEEGVPAPGDVVRLILRGRAFADWLNARKELPDGVVAVGDVVTQKTERAQLYDAAGNMSGPELTDQAQVQAARVKGRTVGVYGPITLRPPKDGSEWYTKAVAAYHALQEPIPAETSSPSDDGVDLDNEPDF